MSFNCNFLIRRTLCLLIYYYYGLTEKMITYRLDVSKAKTYITCTYGTNEYIQRDNGGCEWKKSHYKYTYYCTNNIIASNWTRLECLNRQFFFVVLDEKTIYTYHDKSTDTQIHTHTLKILFKTMKLRSVRTSCACARPYTEFIPRHRLDTNRKWCTYIIYLI